MELPVRYTVWFVSGTRLPCGTPGRVRTYPPATEVYLVEVLKLHSRIPSPPHFPGPHTPDRNSGPLSSEYGVKARHGNV